MFATHLAKAVCGPLVSTVGRWPIQSQQRARRNAAIAATALAQVRAEHQEVEEFLSALARDPGTTRQVEAAHG